MWGRSHGVEACGVVVGFLLVEMALCCEAVWGRRIVNKDEHIAAGCWTKICEGAGYALPAATSL
jgi:hypothetical protein